MEIFEDFKIFYCGLMRYYHFRSVYRKIVMKNFIKSTFFIHTNFLKQQVENNRNQYKQNLKSLYADFSQKLQNTI